MEQAARVSAIQRLTTALQAVHAPREMIVNASNGMYDNIKSELMQPQLALIRDAIHHNLHEIAKEAAQGDFSNEQWEYEDWMNSQEGKAFLLERVRLGYK